MDDWGYITQNATVTEASSPLPFWTTFETTDYWPLTYTLYWSEYRLFGENPLGYHLVNIFLHAANALLLYWLALRIGLGWALGAALLFTLHPLHVQAVAWIAQSKTLLSTFFVLATLLLYHSRRRGWAVVTFLLSLLAKTSGVFLPVVLLLLDRPKSRRDALKLLPFFILATVFGALTVYINSIHFLDTGFAIFQMPWYERLLLVPQNLVFYLNKFVFPYPLAYLYPPADSSKWGWMIFWAGCFCWLRSRWMASYLILIAPCLGLIAIPNMKLSLVADHWAYLPNLFACLFVADRLAILRFPPLNKALWTLLLSGAGILATRHAATFATEEGFWRKAAEVHPGSAPAAYNVAVVLDKNSNLKAAQTEYERTVALDPSHARAWNNLARMHFINGNLADAAIAFDKAIAADPRIVVSYLGLAKVNSLLLKEAEARAVLEKGLLANPGNPALMKTLEESQK